MTFTAVVTAHDGDPAKIVTNLLSQTRRPDEILVYVSDPLPGTLAPIEDIPGIETFIVPNQEDWGHEKRALGLARAKGEFVGFFNHDDEYAPTYVDSMLSAAADADVAYCNWTASARDSATVGACEFRMGSSTSGNWIGRTSVVREAGYHSRQYSADGVLINRILEQKPRIVKVDSILYHHNP